MKIQPKYWSNSGDYTRLTIERVYFGELGYVERRCAVQPRGTDTYYDRHRLAKGDNYAVESDTITVKGNLTEAAIWTALDAAFKKEIRRDEGNLWEYSKGAALGYGDGTKPRKVELPDMAVRQ